MNYHTKTAGFIVAAAAIAGCYTGGDVGPGSTNGSSIPATTVNGTDPASAGNGLPCDVARIVAACASCHGSPPAGGAPNTILTYDDLVAPSLSDSTVSVAAMSVTRMKDAQKPMPPSGGVAADAAVLAAWVAGGMQRATCGDTTITPAAPDTSYNTPTVCTSGQMWTRGTRGSSAMEPGLACIQCHDRGEGPSYSAAGTVYPTAHEPDNCNGTSSSTIQVVITDAAGKTYTTTANSVGNFYFSTRQSPITMPYTAKVVSGSKTRAMVGAQTDGDCNTCHTEKGTLKAPGRVMAP